MCCERSDVPYLPPEGWVDNESEYFASQTRNSLLSKLNRDDGMDVDMGGTERWKWKFRFMAVCCFCFFGFALHSATPAVGRAQNKKMQTNLLSQIEGIQGAGPRICIGWLAPHHLPKM